MHEQIDVDEIPGQTAWGDISQDLDVKYAYKIFGGKSRSDVHDDFSRCVIERADELRFVPDAVFPYYMLAFRDFVEHGRYYVDDASDIFYNYMKLIEDKLKSSPESIIPIIDKLAPSIDRIAKGQNAFSISKEIYGDFDKMRESIFEMAR